MTTFTVIKIRIRCGNLARTTTNKKTQKNSQLAPHSRFRVFHIYPVVYHLIRIFRPKALLSARFKAVLATMQAFKRLHACQTVNLLAKKTKMARRSRKNLSQITRRKTRTDEAGQAATSRSMTTRTRRRPPMTMRVRSPPLKSTPSSIRAWRKGVLPQPNACQLHSSDGRGTPKALLTRDRT